MTSVFVGRRLVKALLPPAQKLHVLHLLRWYTHTSHTSHTRTHTHTQRQPAPTHMKCGAQVRLFGRPRWKAAGTSQSESIDWFASYTTAVDQQRIKIKIDKHVKYDQVFVLWICFLIYVDDIFACFCLHRMSIYIYYIHNYIFVIYLLIYVFNLYLFVSQFCRVKKGGPSGDGFPIVFHPLWAENVMVGGAATHGHPYDDVVSLRLGRK